MTTEVKRLPDEAMQLSTEDRVTAELLSSLDESAADGEVEAAWAAEIERRARRVLAHESLGTSWDEVRSRIGRDLLKR